MRAWQREWNRIRVMNADWRSVTCGRLPASIIWWRSSLTDSWIDPAASHVSSLRETYLNLMHFVPAQPGVAYSSHTTRVFASSFFFFFLRSYKTKTQGLKATSDPHSLCTASCIQWHVWFSSPTSGQRSWSSCVHVSVSTWTQTVEVLLPRFF